MQSSLLNSTLEDKNLSELPNFKYGSASYDNCTIDPQFTCLFMQLVQHMKPAIVNPKNIWHFFPLAWIMSPAFVLCRLLLKQLVTMEVIQWTALWNMYKEEFDNEKNLLGGSLGDKAAEDLKQRIIEHVCFRLHLRYGRVCNYLFLFTLSFFFRRIFLLFQSITQGLHWRDLRSCYVSAFRLVSYYNLSLSVWSFNRQWVALSEKGIIGALRFNHICFWWLLCSYIWCSSLFHILLKSTILLLCFEFCVGLHLNSYTLHSLSMQEAEKHLSEMVVSKALIAKIDRPMGIVSFQIAKDSNDILNSWSANLEKLLDLVEKSCHQIHKETMVHKAALKAWGTWRNWLIQVCRLSGLGLFSFLAWNLYDRNHHLNKLTGLVRQAFVKF